MKHQKQLLVFDWDGTLMDSQARIIHCFHLAIRDMDMAFRTADQVSNIIGLGFREALLALYPELGDDFHEDFVDCYRNYFLAEDVAPSDFFEGVVQMLEDLNGQDYFMAIATGKGRRGLDMALEQHDVKHLFHASRCADETHSKPHPQMLEDLMDYFAVEKDHTLMIGDTEYDLQMASNADVHSLAVSYGVHDKQRLLDCKPLACFENTKELHTWLNESVINNQSL